MTNGSEPAVRPRDARTALSGCAAWSRRLRPGRASRPGAATILAAAATLTACRQPVLPAEPALVATVHSAGPVGYRDPLGIIDPTGTRIVTASTEVLEVRDLAGGAPVRLPSGHARILHLAWDAQGHLVTEQRDDATAWWRYDLAAGTRAPVWSGRLTADSGLTLAPAGLKELAFAADGRAAGVERRADGSRVWIVDSAGRATIAVRSAAALAYPAWLPDGRLACLARENDRQRVTLPCGEAPVAGLEDREAYGPIGVAPDGTTLYLALPNDSGFVETHAWRLDAGPADTTNGQRLGRFARDAYAPSVAADGTVLFKVQDYYTEVLVMPTAGGPAVVRTAFQAETPSWNWTGTELGVTYGTWRRVTDDYRYPDIAQEAGIIPATGAEPAPAPTKVVQASVSEDQGLTWSPNGRWIAFHSHQQGSDDVWLLPADSSAPLTRISQLGRGAEVGWPRWSEDGRWIVFDGDPDAGGPQPSSVWVIGVDQERGRVRVPARRVPMAGFDEEVLHAEWLGSSDELIFTTYRAP
ncbi:MAG: hypothetical protein R2882_02195, partial [Gemmatimonadales bacterium]